MPRCEEEAQAELGAVHVQPMEGVMKSWGEGNKRWNPFISRFFECPMCLVDDKKRDDEVAQCQSSYLEHYEWAFCRFHRWVSRLCSNMHAQAAHERKVVA